MSSINCPALLYVLSLSKALLLGVLLDVTYWIVSCHLIAYCFNARTALSGCEQRCVSLLVSDWLEHQATLL